MLSNEEPKIWPSIKLEKASQLVTKGTTPRTLGKEYVSSGIPFLRAENLLNGAVVLDESTLFIDDETNQLLSRSVILPGDLLISIAGTIGRTGVVSVGAPKMNCNQAVAIVRLSNQLSNRYLQHWFATQDAQCQMAAGKVTQTISNLSLGQIKALTIPFPTSKEQKRIVEILDQADHLRKLRVEADKKAERILPAIFNNMFGDPATNPKKLDKQPIGEVIRVRSGNFLPAKNMATEGIYPVYGGNGVNGYHSEFMFKKRTVVIGRVGAYCGVVHYSEPNCWVTDNALYVTEKYKPIEDEYLAFALHHANLNRYAGRAGQPLISANRIYPIEILVPGEEDQKVFSQVYRDIEKLTLDRAKTKQELERTFSLLMQKAFSGTLTATWREAHMKELLAEMEKHAKYLN